MNPMLALRETLSPHTPCFLVRAGSTVVDWGDGITGRGATPLSPNSMVSSTAHTLAKVLAALLLLLLLLLRLAPFTATSGMYFWSSTDFSWSTSRLRSPTMRRRLSTSPVRRAIWVLRKAISSRKWATRFWTASTDCGWPSMRMQQEELMVGCGDWRATATVVVVTAVVLGTAVFWWGGTGGGVWWSSAERRRLGSRTGWVNKRGEEVEFRRLGEETAGGGDEGDWGCRSSRAGAWLSKLLCEAIVTWAVRRGANGKLYIHPRCKVAQSHLDDDVCTQSEVTNWFTVARMPAEPTTTSPPIRYESHSDWLRRYKWSTDIRRGVCACIWNGEARRGEAQRSEARRSVCTPGEALSVSASPTDASIATIFMTTPWPLWALALCYAVRELQASLLIWICLLNLGLHSFCFK